MADERQIDESLRNLPVPDAVSQRCAAEVVFDDDAIDRGLRAIAIPPGVAERVRQGSRRSGRRATIDLDRSGGWPTQPITGATGAPFRRLRRSAVSCIKAAGMLAMPLAIVVGVFFAGRTLSRRLERPALARAVAPPRVAAPVPTPPRSKPVTVDQPDGSAEAVPVADAPARVAAPASEEPRPPIVLGAAIDVDGGQDLAMRFAPPLGDVRRAVPRTRGYDLAFEMLHGEQPFVPPAASPALAVSRPPLRTGVDSFGAFVARGGRHGGAPRVEEMLAGLSGLAALPDDLRVEARGVAGYRRVDGRRTVIVEVAVAAPRAAARRAPIDATIVLARSATGGALAWQWTCAALGTVARAMAAEDRLTVVVAGVVPTVVVRRAAAVEVDAMARSLVDWPVSGVSDLDAAVREARVFATPVVLVAGAELLDRARADARAALGDWQARMAAGDETVAGDAGSSQVTFVVVDPGIVGAADGGVTFGRTPLDSVAIRRAVVRQVFGGPQDVAEDCRLDVTFSARTVLAYRLVGHRQSAVESASSASQGGETLHAGELVRAVYEIVLADDADGRVIEAVCRWRAPGPAARREQRAVLDVAAVERADPLPGAAACELLLTVGVGDLLADSPHATPRAAVRDALESVAERWRERGDVTPAGAGAIVALDAASRVGN